MEIKEEDLRTFIALYQHAYGITLSMEEAGKELSKLLQLYVLAYLTPIPRPEQVRPVIDQKTSPISSPRQP